jgi:hypothetical protein
MLKVMEGSTVASSDLDSDARGGRRDDVPDATGDGGHDDDVVTASGSSPRWDWRHPSIESVVVLLFLVVAVRIGLSPLHDNSFLTHLSTGRWILKTGSVPSHDIYSWTAHGRAWTVQSWGASVVYASLDKVLGLVGIRLLDAAFTVSLVLLMWRLTRPAKGFLARAVPVGIATCMGTALWVERPLLFGAVALALVLLAADDGLDPRWLVPVMWIWVNTHGSFPFGVGVLVLLAAGRWLDERSRPVVELRALGWATLGTVLGAVNPVGPKMLIFPLELLQKREAFARVAEWQPPHFHRGVELFFAGQLVVALLLVVFRHRKWRAILPLVVFGAMALMSTRNILQASIVLTPIIALAAAGLGSIDGTRRPRLIRPVAIAVALLVVFATVAGVAGPDTDLHSYPGKSASWMRSHGLLERNSRVVARDWVGNFLPAAFGGPDHVRVFIDDRVDMYPLPVIHAFTTLLDPDASKYQPILSKYRATAVLWERDTDFGRWLAHDRRWRVVHHDKTWLVAVPA